MPAHMHEQHAREQKVLSSMADPKVQEVMRDPVVRKLMEEMQHNGMKMEEVREKARRDPAMAEALGKLFSSGLIQGRKNMPDGSRRTATVDQHGNISEFKDNPPGHYRSDPGPGGR